MFKPNFNTIYIVFVSIIYPTLQNYFFTVEVILACFYFSRQILDSSNILIIAVVWNG